MELLLLLINVAGAATLMLWSVRLVRVGFERVHGNRLRAAVRRSDNGRVKAAAIGLGVAMALQSSTAVAVLAAGFAGSEVFSVAQGIALLLGADLGSALAAQLLSFDLEAVIPLLLLIGGTLFLQDSDRRGKQIGRIILGIGLILLSLQLLGDATAPLRDSPFLKQTMIYFERDIVTAFLVGALVTWLMHSSIAAVLLVTTLVAQSVVPLAVGLALVLGANLGSGLIAWALTRDQPPEGRRIPVANLLFRALMAVLVLLALKTVTITPPLLSTDAAKWIIYAHVGFNALMLIICLPFINIMDRITTSLIKNPPESGASLQLLYGRKTAFDNMAMQAPQQALASASRECLRMADFIELMLQPIMQFYEQYDKPLADEVLDLELIVNKMHSDIKMHVAEIDDQTLSDSDRERKLALINFAINTESVGDVIAKNLLSLAEKKNRECLTFSAQGWSELIQLHEQVIANMHLSLNTLISSDLASARQLIAEKDRIRKQERSSNLQHVRRLQSGAPDSIETSDMHLETLSALRQINSLFAAVAYPILTKHGDLLDSRLAERKNK